MLTKFGLTFTALLPLAALAQPPGKGGAAGPGAASREAAALAEPFKGVTTNGTVQPGLFSIRSTGVSTEPVRVAATAFLSALTPQELERVIHSGRRFLLICNGYVLPRLLAPDSLFDAEIQQIIKTAKGAGLRIQTIDLLPLLSQIVEAEV